MVSRLVYGSRAKVDFSLKDLIDLRDIARQRNKELNITGILHYDDGLFYQYLEGEKNALDGLYEKITQDERHRIVNAFYFDDCMQPIFPTWSMELITRDDLETLSLHRSMHDLMQSLAIQIGNQDVIEQVAELLLGRLSKNVRLIETIHRQARIA